MRKPKRSFLTLAVLAAMVMAGCSRPAGSLERSAATSARSQAVAPDPVLDPAWARDALWDDGQAEVALYDAVRPQYGKPVRYQAVFIVVKEDFARRYNVKADPPYEGKGLYPVLKLNAAHGYWTGRYPYHFLASVYVHRDNPAALAKMTLGSQEWCGNTFKEITTWGERPMFTAHSYFDGEGDASHPLDLRPGDLLEDQLPLALRGVPFRSGFSFERRLLPSIIANNLRRAAEPVTARFAVAGEEAVQTPAGARACWKLTATWPDVQQSWWFEKARPHALVKMESSDGRSWLLRSRVRKAYWREATFRPAEE